MGGFEVTPELLLQAGAFGLIVYIVAIIYPRSARDSREERESRDKAFMDLAVMMQDKFEERNNKIIAAVERQTMAITESLHDSSDRLEKIVTTACKAK